MIEDFKTYKFPEDRFNALKESQRLCGLNQTEFDLLLKILATAYEGGIGFGRPDEFSIHFGVSALVLRIMFDLDSGLMSRKTEFRFSLKELGLSDEEPGYDWKNENITR